MSPVTAARPPHCAMPTFCRHNRLIQNCPICARELHVELRPIVTPGAPRRGQPEPSRGAGATPRAGAAPRAGRPPGRPGSRPPSSSGSGRSAGVTVRRLARGADDGYRSDLVAGLRSRADAERLAQELAFAAARLERLAADPPGLYAEVADPSGELEERSWLAFLIAYLGPLDGDGEFAGIDAARTSWSSGAAPELAGVAVGPRGAHTADGGGRAIEAYRAWAVRAGSQAAALTGEAAWTPERRFARAIERLALPGLSRAARFDLLATLGAAGVYELRAQTLALGGSDPVTLAAKRLLGIGDTVLLERRAAALAGACGLPLEALDVGFFNWERAARARLGMDASVEPREATLEAIRGALGL